MKYYASFVVSGTGFLNLTLFINKKQKNDHIFGIKC